MSILKKALIGMIALAVLLGTVLMITGYFQPFSSATGSINLNDLQVNLFDAASQQQTLGVHISQIDTALAGFSFFIIAIALILVAIYVWRKK